MAKPHGFSAATSPAANAKLTRPWSTNAALPLLQRRNPTGQLLLGHRRGGVVHKRGRSVGVVEHPRRLPGHVVTGPDRAIGVIDVGEVQVVFRDEVLHRPHVGVSRDAYEG